MPVNIRSYFLQVLLVVMLSACVTVPADFEQPRVTVVSFKPVSSGNLFPEFEIVLRVTNPNRTALALEGMSYTIDLDGHEVVSGVANDLPVIDAYGEGNVKLRATASLLAGLNVLSGLVNQGKNQVDYAFNARLDVGTFMPSIRVNKTGAFSLAPKQ